MTPPSFFVANLSFEVETNRARHDLRKEVFPIRGDVSFLAERYCLNELWLCMFARMAPLAPNGNFRKSRSKPIHLESPESQSYKAWKASVYNLSQSHFPIPRAIPSSKRY